VYSSATRSDDRGMIEDVLHRMYILDACKAFRDLVASNVACYPLYDTSDFRNTRLYHMGHLQLPAGQVRNPCSVKKNLIMTGPNAAGKTTYVKALCSNILLAQSFGVAVAWRATIHPYHAIGSFMRMHDVLGNMSLFEAEAKRCAEIVRHAQHMSQDGKPAIYFLDEPMHSTPPAEGASTCLATVEHMGNLPYIRTVVTTHYHQITELARASSALFQNVSMEAIPQGDNAFVFPYRVRSGPSYQCIALELLEDASIPKELIARAIKWKNKICTRQVNDA
jgi:DNA mismatch repair ATPase MutS